jgi:hypothetical protein
MEEKAYLYIGALFFGAYKVFPGQEICSVDYENVETNPNSK